MEDEEGYTVLNLPPNQRQPGRPPGAGPQGIISVCFSFPILSWSDSRCPWYYLDTSWAPRQSLHCYPFPWTLTVLQILMVADSHQHPHWIRIALGVGWVGNIVLLAAVIALGLQVFQLQVPCEERTRAVTNSLPSDGASHRPTNGTERDAGLEDFLSRLKQFLCDPPSKEGSGCRLCPTEWLMHRGRCYWASKESRIWHKSQDDCSAKRSRLLVIRDQKEMDFISSATQDTNPVWLGLTMTPPEWKWTWVDGSLLDQTLFPVVGPGERNSCGVIKGKQIHSETCNAVVKWICEKEALLV